MALSQIASRLGCDDLLFFMILLIGFHTLMRLGELVWPALRDYRKVLQITTAEQTTAAYYTPIIR